MYLERKQDLSIYYWLKDKLGNIDSSIKIEDGFPVENLILPSVSVEADSINISPGEIGNKHGYQTRVWFIDIFAVNKSQRDDIAYYLIRELENDIPVYNYDEGFPPNVAPTQINALKIKNIDLNIVRVLPQLVTKLYYRATISFESDDGIQVY